MNNLTAIYHAPAFATHSHFRGTNQTVQDGIIMLNKEGNVQGNSEWDDYEFAVEPYSGTTFSARAAL